MIEIVNILAISDMIQSSLIRVILGLLFVIILFRFGYGSLLKFNNPYKSLIIVIPGIIVAVNNFPIIAYFDGRTTLSEPVYEVYLFILECLSVGFFEEIVFRVVILIFLLQKLPKTKKGVLYGIIISSSLFGLIHLFNLFSGASIDNTILQVGYSFLVGMMWAVMYLRTKNIWLVILLHASYNFFGSVLFELGTVTNRYDVFTIILTSVIGIIVALYSIKLFTELSERPLSV